MIKANEILTNHNKFHINLGLDRISKILNLLNNPQKNYKIIHIAGTNGKGSTSKLINEFLIEHFENNKKIGLFTSPHLFSYTERIKINNREIDENVFDNLVNEIINNLNWMEEFYFHKECRHKIILNSDNSYSQNIWATILNEKEYNLIAYSKKAKVKNLKNNWVKV